MRICAYAHTGPHSSRFSSAATSLVTTLEYAAFGPIYDEVMVGEYHNARGFALGTARTVLPRSVCVGRTAPATPPPVQACAYQDPPP